MNAIIISMLNMIEIINMELFDKAEFIEFVIKFSFNLFVIFTLVRFLYYPQAKRKDYLFTYLLLGTIIYLLTYILKGKNLDTGLALGLFAIFGIIRYRTRQIPIKEMTYLFLVIGISVINSLVSKKVSLVQILFVNLVLVFIVYILEKVWLLKHEIRKTIVYEKIELIKPEHRIELVEDLELRTGLKINRVEIGKIDFLKDTAQVRIYYFDSEQGKFIDDMNIVDDNDDD